MSIKYMQLKKMLTFCMGIGLVKIIKWNFRRRIQAKFLKEKQNMESVKYMEDFFLHHAAKI